MSTRLLRLSIMVTFLAVLGACSTDITDSESTSVPLASGLTLVEAQTGEVVVCKRGPDGSWAEFAITSDNVAPTTTAVTLYPTSVVDCALVWESDGAGVSNVTIAEVDRSPGTVLDAVAINGFFVEPTPTSVTVAASADASFQVDFKNIEGDEPPPGDQGCTPGYWRQAHHYDDWSGAAPGDNWSTLFDDPGSHQAPGRFGAQFNGTTTLGVAVQLGGGGVFALARHAVAAALNAMSPDVEYGMTLTEVVDLVNDALASGDYESAKDVLVELNEAGCPL